MFLKSIGASLILAIFSFNAHAIVQTERGLNAPINIEESLPQETVPVMTNPSGNEVLSQDYSHLDPNHLVPEGILRQAVNYYDVNLSRIANKDYMTLVDFNQHSSKSRMFLVNMKTGAVTAQHAAVGAGSDTNADGYADVFSNIVDSHMSSLGFYLTSSTYEGANGYSLRLHGLSVTNSAAYERFIVVHGAAYVSESESRAGNSWGCPAVDKKLSKDLIDRIKSGSLLFMSHASLRL